jgi:CelD/BcsL family acetyltransferase involved in cellulose biosynthesis
MSWTILPASEFAAHAETWQRLNDDSVASPLLDVEFVQPLLTEFGAGKELLAFCEIGQQVVAMAILRPRHGVAWETFQPSQAPIGMWLHRSGLDLDALLAALLRALPGWPMLLALTQVDPELMARPAARDGSCTIDYVSTARIAIRGSFDDYWNARSKNLRTNLKKQRAKLARAGICPRIERSRDPRDMAQAIADYGRLESAGWKAQGDTSIHADNAQGRFYRAMLEGFCRRGAGEVLRYWFGDQLVAMNLCIEGRDSLIVLKTTYDEQLSNHCSPAFLMREETCQRLFLEQRLGWLEFYGRAMEWHLRWTKEVRTLYHVNHYRRPVLMRLHALMRDHAATLERVRARVQARPPLSALGPTPE